MSQEAFENVINNLFFWITWFFELVGALIIIVGAVACIIKYIRSVIQNKQVPLKMLLANQLALGLEFMLAAEILKTVITTNRNKDELVMLAAIVLLRAALSVLIHWELKNEEKREEVKEKAIKKLANRTNEKNA
jgi:uncharacterized membrane protein